jgi:integrase/recombinase XerD
MLAQRRKKVITEYFKWGQSLTRLLATPAGPHLSAISEELKAQGFSYWILRRRLQGAAHCSDWNRRQGRPIGHLHESMLEEFEAHLGTCRCRTPLRLSSHDNVRLLAGAQALLDYLRRCGVIISVPPSNQAADPPALVAGFFDWMRSQRGTQEGTLRQYGVVIKDVLEALGTDPRLYRAESIRTFILSRTKGRTRANAKEVTSVMRMFLRYLIAEGKCRTGLDDAVPRLAMWRLSALPRYLPAADIERVIAACDRETAVGLRDRAAILLLARLGLRAGDIRQMDLPDIDWTHASVRVSGKSRYEASLPLTQEVGDAVLEYLRKGRPPVPGTRLFVRMQAPWRPLQVSAVSAIVGRAIARAGVDASFHGAHVLRHSAATEMLRQGATLQQVGVVLRHRYLDTTAHYAKVDVQRLRDIALPWPEVFPC